MFPIHDKNPTKIIPIFTLLFIVSCVVIFLWQISHDGSGQTYIVYAFGVIPSVIFGDAVLPVELQRIPEIATIITSMFLHGGWMHLIGNMLYLWVFGNNIEEAMGHFKFILFYLCCGIFAVFAQALPDINSNIPMIGASGAISGILGAYLLLYPRAVVTVLVPIFIYLKTFQIKAMWVLLFWFGIQLVQSYMNMGNEGGGVAFGAHIGGFIAGMLLCPFFKKKHIPIALFSRYS